MIKKFSTLVVALLPLVVSGCAVTPTKFYENPSAVKDTTLCRTFLEAVEKGNDSFAVDTAKEAVGRGLSLQGCKDKVAAENAAIIGIAAVATGVAVVAACQGGGCRGGGYSSPYSKYGSTDYDCWGGGGDGPLYVRGPFRLSEPDYYGLDADGDGIACEPYQDIGS